MVRDSNSTQWSTVGSHLIRRPTVYNVILCSCLFSSNGSAMYILGVVADLAWNPATDLLPVPYLISDCRSDYAFCSVLTLTTQLDFHIDCCLWPIADPATYLDPGSWPWLIVYRELPFIICSLIWSVWTSPLRSQYFQLQDSCLSTGHQNNKITGQEVGVMGGIPWLARQL